MLVRIKQCNNDMWYGKYVGLVIEVQSTDHPVMYFATDWQQQELRNMYGEAGRSFFVLKEDVEVVAFESEEHLKEYNFVHMLTKLSRMHGIHIHSREEIHLRSNKDVQKSGGMICWWGEEYAFLE